MAGEKVNVSITTSSDINNDGFNGKHSPLFEVSGRDTLEVRLLTHDENESLTEPYLCRDTSTCLLCFILPPSYSPLGNQWL